jgi:thiol-disulfide isomerase/thioredoxin
MPMRLGSPLPSLDGATEWFNTDGVSLDNLKNRPVLVHFWAVSCHICHEVMPDVIAYRDLYKDHGLKLVGVHMPKRKPVLPGSRGQRVSKSETQD